MANVLSVVRMELRANVDNEYKAGSRKYFKEEISLYGVRTPVVRQLLRKHFPKGLPEKGLVELCEKLLGSGKMEEGTIAFGWAERAKLWEPEHLALYEKWVSRYVSNWGWCDSLCGGVLGRLMVENPEMMERTEKWARSPNMWLRRASAVSLIPATRKMDITRQVFRTTGLLMYDKQDLVQKGAGWLLKETANNPRLKRRVLDFLLLYKDAPRTLLRYATENMEREEKAGVLGWE